MIRKYLALFVTVALLLWSLYLLGWNVANSLFWHIGVDDNYGIYIGTIGTPIFLTLLILEAYLNRKRVQGRPKVPTKK